MANKQKPIPAEEMDLLNFDIPWNVAELHIVWVYVWNVLGENTLSSN